MLRLPIAIFVCLLISWPIFTVRAAEQTQQDVEGKVEGETVRYPKMASVPYERRAVVTNGVILIDHEEKHDNKYTRSVRMSSGGIPGGTHLDILARSPDKSESWIKWEHTQGRYKCGWVSTSSLSIQYIAEDYEKFCATRDFDPVKEEIGLWRAKIDTQVSIATDFRCSKQTEIKSGELMLYVGENGYFDRFLIGPSKREVFISRKPHFSYDERFEFVTGLPENLSDEDLEKFLTFSFPKNLIYKETEGFKKLSFPDSFEAWTLYDTPVFKSPYGAYDGRVGFAYKTDILRVYKVFGDRAFVSPVLDSSQYGWVRKDSFTSVANRKSLVASHEASKTFLFLATLIYFPYMLFTKKGKHIVSSFGHYIFEEMQTWKLVLLGISFLALTIVYFSLYSDDAWKYGGGGLPIYLLFASPFILFVTFIIYIVGLWFKEVATSLSTQIKVNEKMRDGRKGGTDHKGVTRTISGRHDDLDRTIWSARYEKHRANAVRDLLKAKTAAFEAQESAAMSQHAAKRAKEKMSKSED